MQKKKKNPLFCASNKNMLDVQGIILMGLFTEVPKNSEIKRREGERD